jgi:5'-nucleotidase
MSTHTFTDISKARVLISNDDGIHAPGLKVLEKAIRAIAREVWVIAPTEEQSAAGHAITLRRPLRINKLKARRYTVDGTPTDCVLLGLNEVMRESPPDLVVSGINRGGNMGDDVTYSGTIAAAIEATILGIPSIAFSQHFEDGHPVKWATGAHWIPAIMKKLKGFSLPNNALLNINFPDVMAKQVTDIQVTKQGARKFNDEIKKGSDPRGNPYYWIGAQQLETRNPKGTDMSTVLGGGISITPLSVDLTDTRTAKSLKTIFS